MKTLISSFLTLLLCTGHAFAANDAVKAQFKTLDTDGNGYLSANEVQARPGLIRFTNLYPAGSFAAADFNKDGHLDINEFLANEEPVSAE